MTSLLAVWLLAILSLILIMFWRVLAVGIKNSENAPLQQRPDHRLNLGFLNSYDIAPDAGDRASNYLRRVVALTSATCFGDGYALDVGTNTFHVRERHVIRLQGATSTKRRYAQTCYLCPNNAIPAAEKIATALLMLKNDPTLFDRWAAQNGAFKADGHEFKEPFFWFWNTPGP